MPPALHLDVLAIVQALHDQFVDRLTPLQESFDRHEFQCADRDRLMQAVARLTTTAECLEDIAMDAHDSILADMFDALGYAGREALMGTPCKGLSELKRVQCQITELRNTPESAIPAPSDPP